MTMTKDKPITQIEINRKIWEEILRWGDKNMRDYPWRHSPDGYKILIAEIILHRTKADQVNMIYENFINTYPDLRSIAEAGEDKIKSDLHSLGLAWRSELLYSMSLEILEKYDGTIPRDKADLMDLPGVGHYIASAVLCFGYNLPEPVIDTNTVRVIGRIFGLKITDSSRRSKKFKKFMSDIISHGRPREFSLSLIDFASLICTAGAYPKCNICPLKDICSYHLNQKELT